MELIRENIYNSFIYQDRYKYYLTGLGNTIIMAFFACLIGVILGLILSLVIDYNEKTGKLYLLSAFARMYIGIIRGTPALLQLMILYYIIFKSVNINIVVVGIISFGLNSGAYVSQIIRSGLISIPKGQEEAGLVLGMTKSQIFFRVKLLQMVKRIIPPMSNEILTLVKDTSLARIIALQEIIWAGQAFMKGSQGISGQIWPLFFTAIYYLIFNGILTVILGKLEKKLDYFR